MLLNGYFVGKLRLPTRVYDPSVERTIFNDNNENIGSILTLVQHDWHTYIL